MKITFSIVLFLLLSCSLRSQVNTTANDRYLRTRAYLEVCIDQLNTGLFKSIRDFNFDTMFIDNMRFEPLDAAGFPSNFSFYSLTIKYPGYNDYMSYSFCFEKNAGMLYKLKGFIKNDYAIFFDRLKYDKFNISKQFFRKKKLAVAGLDFSCLIEAYTQKNRSSGVPVNKPKSHCLYYNFQPVTTY